MYRECSAENLYFILCKLICVALVFAVTHLLDTQGFASTRSSTSVVAAVTKSLVSHSTTSMPSLTAASLLSSRCVLLPPVALVPEADGGVLARRATRAQLAPRSA